MANPNYANIATTTIESRTRTLADNITNNNALLRRLRQRGKKKPVSGGRNILQELDFAATTNVGWYSGLGTLATAAFEHATAAEFAIKEAYASLIISGLEMAQNRGREQMIDLLEARINNMERSLGNLLNTGVYSDGTASSGNQLGGLALLVALTPTSGTVGNINRATATYWRNLSAQASTAYGGASTSATILNHMGRTYNAISRNADVPDLITADATSYQLFMDAMNDRQTIIDVEMAKAGFITAKFRNADVVLDGGIGGACPANTMFFLNTEYIHYRPMEGMDVYRIGGDREPDNQDAMLRLIGWKGNMTLSNASLQAVFRVN
jgi:hypothetical protein